MDLDIGLIKFLLSLPVEFLGLAQVEVELSLLTFTLLYHVAFPLLSTLLHPLFHETGIALKLVDLNAAHFLFAKHISITVISVETGGVGCLAFLLTLEALQMVFEVNFFLSTIQFG